MDSTHLELDAGLELEDVVRRLVGSLRMHDCCNRSLAFYLWEVQSRRLMQRMGYPDAVTFAACELEMSRRRAQELVATGRVLLELKEVDRAFREGELCWSKVRILVRVATVETERAWVERAKEVTCRELQVRAARELPRHRPGMAMTLEGPMSLEGIATPRSIEPSPAEDAEPPLTLDSIPAVVSARWWLDHEDQFEWRKDGTVRLKSDRLKSDRLKSDRLKSDRLKSSRPRARARG